MNFREYGMVHFRLLLRFSENGNSCDFSLTWILVLVWVLQDADAKVGLRVGEIS